MAARKMTLAENRTIDPSALSDIDFVRYQARHARQGMKQSLSELGSRLKSGKDLQQFVDRHPLATVGMAAAAGVLAANVVGRTSAPRATTAAAGSPSTASSVPRSEKGVHSFLTSLLGPVIKNVQQTAVTAVQHAVMNVVSDWMARRQAQADSATDEPETTAPSPVTPEPPRHPK